MSLLRTHALVALIAAIQAFPAAAPGQANRDPHIGYLYPGGGQRGTTFRIIAGGQFLRGAKEVFVSGDGVKAAVVTYFRPLFNINREQRYLLMKRMAAVREKRIEEAGVPDRTLKTIRARSQKMLSRLGKNVQLEGIKFPEHHLLENLDEKSLRQLVHLKHVLFFPRQKLQRNRQLAESVLIEISVDARAAPGLRELRIATSNGLTNPVVMEIGQLPEVRELEPNDRSEGADFKRIPLIGTMPRVEKLLSSKPFTVPFVLNGQIMPGDIDRFRFRAKKDQRLVMTVSARSLVPYLADAVPGWFQATLAVYDAQGKEVAYADDYRFMPDPVLYCEIPASGIYELEIRDAIYRGREDFVYRLAVGEVPFITRAFPLGGREGAKTIAAVDGWNLSGGKMILDTDPGDAPVRRAAYTDGRVYSNAVSYRVDDLPETGEGTHNDRIEDARTVEMPVIVNGRIEQPGDVDVFAVDGAAGDRVVAAVWARRLNSPLDSLLRLTDGAGTVIAWNDDAVVKKKHLHIDEAGLITHHADAYLTAELPKKGRYYVQLSDAQRHGGDAWAYRLRISAPRPDFALRVTPSSVYTVPGAIQPVAVYAIRKDGFDGPIRLRVKSPAGFQLQGGSIPAGRTHVRLTLKAPLKSRGGPVALKLEGVAEVGGKTIRRVAGAADDVMQAFLYRHLLPAEECMVYVRKQKWPAPQLSIAGKTPVRIAAGAAQRIVVKTRKNRMLKEIVLQLNQPPGGVAIKDVAVVDEGLAFSLTTDEEPAADDFSGNLIVQVFREFRPKGKKGGAGKRNRRWPIGYLPAIPVEIVGK